MNILPKVSVIVPVYKAEEYLHICVNSLLTQTLTDIEILLIDDGSPDRSGAICDSFAQKDKRVKAFHHANHGVSYTRQFGVDQASGEFTIHVDPDDWVEKDMLETLYNKAKAEDADVVICDILQEKNGKITYIKQQPLSLYHKDVLCEMFYRLHGSCCNKLIRRSCYKDYGVKFPLQLSCCEDLYVVSAILNNPVKVTYVGKAFYHYIVGVNQNSLVKKVKRHPYLIPLFEDLLPREVFLNYVVPAFFNRQVKAWFRDAALSDKDFRRRVREREDCVSVLWQKKLRKKYFKIKGMVFLSYLPIRRFV